MVTHDSHFIHYNVFRRYFARKKGIKIQHFVKKKGVFTYRAGGKIKMVEIHKKAERLLGALPIKF